MKRREQLFGELRSLIVESADYAVSAVRGCCDSNVGGQGKSYETLGRRLDDEALAAFERVLFLRCYVTVMGMLSLVDGSTGPEGFHVALVDLETQENLAPVNGTLSDEFCRYVLDREEEPDWPIRLP